MLLSVIFGFVAAANVVVGASDSEAAAQTFDYIVVGGGTCGLVIANRLTENPNVSVAVIEVGDSVYNNTNVTSVSGYGLAFGTAIDWAFETVNQTFAGGRTQVMRAGKAIGGTSTINGMSYTRGQNSQVDNWNSLGKGWNWASLFPYYLKSETLEVPSSDQAARGTQYNASDHGTSGPVKVGWVNGTALANTTTHQLIEDTARTLGVPIPLDIAGGLMNGYYLYPATLDTAANIRFDAARAYYYPVDNRPNLKLFPNTLAEHLVWSSGTSSSKVATGVNITSAGVSSVLSATKEVIVSAGSLRTPAFLEHSGIGNPSILSAAGVNVVVNLPGVGENLQDQTNNGLNAKTNASYSGVQSNVLYPTANEVYDSSASSVKAALLANLTSYAQQTAAINNNATNATALYTLFKMQADLLFDGKTPIAEIIVSAGKYIVSAQTWTLLPFSRGSVHISSSNTSVPTTINPNYYSLDFDLSSQAAVSRYIRRMFGTAPLSHIFVSETKPGLKVVGADSTDAEWFAWMKSSYRSNFHPVATAAMMPREMGGVVNANLTVYGTTNVRVVDASVLPFQMCGHLMSTLYAVSERAADLIKAAA